MEEVVLQNMTGRQWIASESWATSPVFHTSRFLPFLGGTLGIAIRRGEIEGLHDFLLHLLPSGDPRNNMLKIFWENMFGCSFETGDKETDGEQVKRVCTGQEDLSTTSTPYTDVSELRAAYNVYKAVYALAHALHDLMRCEEGKGPFIENKCANISNLKPWQLVHYLQKVNFTTSFGDHVSFDKNGDALAIYDVMNWKPNSDGAIRIYTVGVVNEELETGMVLTLDENAIYWNFETKKPPQSVCSESCPPGTRRATRKGLPACCFDCLPCGDGEISNTTDVIECMVCPHEFWSSPNKDQCVPKKVEFLSYEDPLGISLTTASLLGTCISVTLMASSGTCKLQGHFALNGMYQDGDFLIGGLFEVQYLKAFPELSYKTEPKLPRCELFYMTSFQQAQTMVFAISEINNNPRLLPNITLGYKIFDNCLRLGVAFRGAIALFSGTEETVSDLNCKGPPPVIGIIGDPGSTHSIAISSVLGLFRVPMISFYATCSCLSDRKKYPSFFRTIPSDAFQVRAMVQILRHFGWIWVGLLYSNNDYGVYAAQSFHQEMQLFGYCVAFSEILPYDNNPRDIQRIMGVIQASTARVVVVFSHSSLLIHLMNEVVLQNMTGRQWIASEAWATSPMFHTPRYHPFLGGTLSIAIRRGEIQGLRDFLLRLRPNTDQRNNMLRIFWEKIFGCSFEPESIETDGEQVKKVCTGLEDLNTTNTPYTDVSGLRASYNVYKAVYALAHALHDLMQCEKGRGPFSGNSCADMSNLKPWQLVHYIQKVNFTTGFGDHVSFDKNGDAVAIYDVLNWQPSSDGTIRFHKVGVVSEGAATEMVLMLNEDAIFWNFKNKKPPRSVCSESCPPGTRRATKKGLPVCCFDCLQCGDGQVSNTTDATECIMCPDEFWSSPNNVQCVPKEVQFLSYEDPLGISLTTASLLGTCFCALVLVIFAYHRHTPIVRANNSELSFLLLLSLKLCFLCVLLFIALMASSGTCKLQGHFTLNGMYQDGDFLIGGLFEVQYLKTFPEPSFRMEPKLPRCELFYMTSFQEARTMVFAINDINNNPSLLPNITLGYQIFDNCLRLGVAFRGAIALFSGTEETVSDLSCKGPPPVIGIIGDPGSTHSIAISSVLGLFRVPMISYYATCSCLSDRKKYPSFFRTIPSDAFQVWAMVQILRHFGWTWVGLIYSDNDYGVYAAQLFHQEMQLFGHCVAFSEILPNDNNPRDIQRIMGVIQASTARVVVVFSASSLLIPLIDEVVLQNMTGRQWIASEAWATSPMFHTSRYHPFLGGTLGIAIRHGEIQGLQDFLLHLRPNTDQRNNMLRIFWENMFGCRFETESKETDGEQVKRFCTGLEDLSTTNTPYTDVSGLRSSYNVYKAVYALAHALHDLIQCEKGRGPFSGNSCADISDLKPWQKVNFTTGFGDHVSFDKNGDALVIYDVLNWKPSSDALMASSGTCKLQGHFTLNGMYQDGDFLIGGLFEVQYLKAFPEPSFRMEPKLPRCELFSMTSFQEARTMVFAINEINNNPSLLPNITLGYQIFDNCLRLGVAFRGAIALFSGTEETVSDLNCKGPPPVIGIIGDPGSTHSIAISSVLGLFRVPMISYYATCSCLSDRKKYPSFFRTIPSDAFQVRAMVQILRHFGWTWVGLIYSDNDYGVYAAQLFHLEMQLFGHCVAFSEILPNDNNPRDIQRIMGVIQASTARVVVVFSSSSLLIPLIDEVVLQNMTGKQWIASEAWATSPMFHTSRYHPFLGGTLGIAIRHGEIQGLQDFLLRLRPNTDQRNNMLRIFWENMFGCRFETESKETDGEQVKRFCTGLEDLSTTNTPYTDVSGLRSSYNVYKAVYALAHALHDLIQCEKGRGPFSGNSCADMSNLKPWQLVHYLQKVNFTTGFGDHVSFDKNGDALVIYDVLNWKPSSDALMASSGTCKLQGHFTLNGMYQDGDFLIGGLFEVQYLKAFPEPSFRMKPKLPRCELFYMTSFQEARTMVFAINDINNNPSLLPNITLGYQIFDNCLRLGVAFRGAIALFSGTEETVSDLSCKGPPPVIGIIGDPGSTHSIAISSVLGLFRVPMISFYATCSCLSDRKKYPSFFRTIPSDAFQVRAMVQILRHFGWIWVGLLYSNNDYGVYAAQSFHQEMQLFGYCVAFSEILPYDNNPRDIQRIMGVIQASTARVVVVFSHSSLLIHLMNEVVLQNMTGRQWIASEAWATSPMFHTPRYHPFLGGTLSIAIRRGEIQGLRDFLLRLRPNTDQRNNMLRIFWEKIFGCSFEPESIETDGEQVKKVCTGLEDLNTTNTPYTDVSGLRASYNVYKAVYALAHALHDLMQCEKGRGPFSGNSCADMSNLKPWQLVHYIQKVNFTTGFGDHVSFDKNGDAVAIYDVLNWQPSSDGTIRFHKVGVVSEGAATEMVLMLNEDAIFWNFKNKKPPRSVCSESCPPGTRRATKKGLPVCCFDCLQCGDGQVSNTTDATECIMCPDEFWSSPNNVQCVPKEVQFLSYEDPLGISLTTASLLGTCFCALVLVIFAYHRHTPIVRANNSELSFLLLLSLKLCFLCVLLFIEIDLESATSERSSCDDKTYEELLEVVTRAVDRLKLDWPQEQETLKRSKLDDRFLSGG
ncbi:extracellular calcium-sensing receptor-like protein [Labeo rohita]|uniref:Extracellular calcium-sensing receptor-like protein n=1 Tax=Labeo rohita TaxID=84645 RepID=A0A498N997_LABRO|nr:extracellular calcium-sensing receptor-like protein [Labeo rohita]